MTTSQEQLAQIQTFDEVAFSSEKTTKQEKRGKVIAENQGHYFVEVVDRTPRVNKDGYSEKRYHTMVPKKDCRLIRKSILNIKPPEF